MICNARRAAVFVPSLLWIFLLVALDGPALSLLGPAPTCAATPGVAAPPAIEAAWELGKADRRATPTRERVCLNGLWRWQPAKDGSDSVPTDNWGAFKVPGFWPGNGGYLQEDSQTLHRHPSWKGANLRTLNAAWYEREITIPPEWIGRRIDLSMEYLNSFATVYVDGKKLGEIRYPAGAVELGAACRAGGKHTLSVLVQAMPLKGVMLSYADTNAAREVRGTVERRGPCGDVTLVGSPAGARIVDVKVDPSFRKSEITVDAALEGLAADVSYGLRVEIRKGGRVVRELASRPFQASDLKSGRVAVTEPWKPDALWDLHTPQNQLEAHVSLVEARGTLRDAFDPVKFGFRELWIDGRDFFLNDTRIHLSAVPLDNAQIGARTATYAAARETLARLRSFGINLVYTHNYGCQPGSHVSFAEILRAADDAGMLVAFSQPHFAHYDWKAPDADRANGYARHAEFYVHAAQNHPSVVAYAMSHNATGYDEDMNPDKIDGRTDPREPWARNNAALALRAEAIVKALDPNRIVYHHASGNLGALHTSNFYLNFVPVQEVSDWFEHWAATGVKPVFLCEYGVPFTWDWTMYRGWYKGQREFGSARVPWEFCLAEWNAQFLGDRAFRISEAEKANLRWEAAQFRAGRLWHRWDYPHPVGSSGFDDRQEVLAMYLKDNGRAHRAWGLSAGSPWEYEAFWKLRPSVDRGRRKLAANPDDSGKPGFSPDEAPPTQGLMSVDFERSDWVPTAAANALLRNNQPLLAYLGGKAGHVTSKDHNVSPGQTVEKQIIVINETREPVSCECNWSLDLPQRLVGQAHVSVRTGEQQRVPLRFDLPAALPSGRYELRATVRFSTGETQDDSFVLHVVPPPPESPAGVKIALFDPKGETAALFAARNVPVRRVDADADLSDCDLLVVGKQALTPDGPGPDVSRVRDGLKVIVFEQSARVLDQRFGFRVAEYGLRQVFPRVPGHPLLDGLETEHWRDWRGEATVLPSRLEYTLRPRYGPTVAWCGLDVTRAWRRGCRGNVASVLIEKPARGDFLPVVDGGYGLQYSPLVEYHDGQGLVLFCQLDVTGRTEPDPAADILVGNMIRYVSAWKPSPRRQVVYAGEPAGRAHLEAVGIQPREYAKGGLSPDSLLVVAKGGGPALHGDAADIGRWLEAGGRVLALGVDAADARALPASKISLSKQEHIAAFFEPPAWSSPLQGIGPADVHNRDPRELLLVSGGASPLGNGILASDRSANLVVCQLVPWQFDSKQSMNLKRTFRRSAYVVSRLLANLGAPGATPMLERFRNPVREGERRWLDGLYLDVPEEWDDPYRFFRW